MRLWNELRRENALAMARAGKGEELGDRPGMWEVDLNPGEKAAFDTEVDLDLVQYTVSTEHLELALVNHKNELTI